METLELLAYWADMTHPVGVNGEVELKFELDAHASRKVRHHPLLARTNHKTRSQSTIYFDTKKGKLSKKGYSLRVRKDGDCITQTVKSDCSSAGLFDRGEWEAPVLLMEPNPEALKHTPLRKFKKFDRLGPVVRSQIKRTTWMVEQDGSAVEIVLDSGTVSAGGTKSRVRELELELKCGQSRALFEIAAELSRAASLDIGVLSKQERGRMLAEGSLGHVHKASAPAVREELSVGQAFALLVHECIRHFRLNESAILADRDPEALHQARVAIRRLRTVFSLFRPAIRQGSLQVLRDQLGQFIAPFGEARNLDVVLAHHGQELDRRDYRKLRSARSDVYDQVNGVLNAQSSRDMFLDLVEWTASGDWQKELASAPVGKFASERLDAVWDKVRRRGSRLADLEGRQLHRLRINIKKLRYAVEFFAALYPRKDIRNFKSQLEKLQDCLGRIHDDMIADQLFADLSLGPVARIDASERSRQTRAMEAHFKQLKRLGRIWSPR